LALLQSAAASVQLPACRACSIEQMVDGALLSEAALWLSLVELSIQGGKAVPGDLHADTEDDERHHPQYSVDGSRGDCPREARRVGIAEVTNETYHDNCQEETGVAKAIGNRGAV
jgi:hypothetical protein